MVGVLVDVGASVVGDGFNASVAGCVRSGVAEAVAARVTLAVTTAVAVRVARLVALSVTTVVAAVAACTVALAVAVAVGALVAATVATGVTAAVEVVDTTVGEILATTPVPVGSSGDVSRVRIQPAKISSKTIQAAALATIRRDRISSITRVE